MPALYDFQCPDCGFVEEDVFVEANKRDEFELLCDRAHSPEKMTRMFPNRQAFHSFEPYFDPGLNCDVHGRRERQQIMSALDVTEAGDAKHGGRNVEVAETAAKVDIQEATGRRLSDIQREKEIAQEVGANWHAGFVHGDSAVEGPSLDSLEDPATAVRKGKTSTRTKRISALSGETKKGE